MAEKGPLRFRDPAGRAMRKLVLWISGDPSDVASSPNIAIESSTDIVVDNPIATGSSIYRLGTDTSATSFEVQNDSETALFSVTGDGAVSFAGAANLTLGDDDKLYFGAVPDVSAEWVSASDDWLFDQITATSSTIFKLGTATSATDWQVQDGSGTAHLLVDGAGDVTIGATTGATITRAGKDVYAGSAGSTGLVTKQQGTSATEGWNEVVYEGTISPAAVETAVLTVPAGSVVTGVWANVDAALTGGGTTATWSLGISAGDLDGFGTATSDNYTTASDDLTQNAKWTAISGDTPLGAAGALIGLFSATAQAIVLTGTQTGGTAAGDTALTVGDLRVRIEYKTALPMDNA